MICHVTFGYLISMMISCFTCNHVFISACRQHSHVSVHSHLSPPQTDLPEFYHLFFWHSLVARGGSKESLARLWPPTAPSKVHDAGILLNVSCILCVILHLYYLCHFPILDCRLFSTHVLCIFIKFRSIYCLCSMVILSSYFTYTRSLNIHNHRLMSY